MRLILPTIVVSQFFCTSLWFAGNAVVPDITRDLHLGPGFLANLTSAVQMGFIMGTLVFALLIISDRFSPSLVFFVCSLVAGLFSLGMILKGIGANEILAFRFFTGFFLAGIYPVGMKIASDHYQKGLGKSLGFLVGALVLGTASPHLLKNFTVNLPWRYVIYSTAALSAIGGLLMLAFVPNGPFRKQSRRLNLGALLSGFSNKNFRSASFGYFGHMWELYSFWAFVPVMLASYNDHYPLAGINVPLFSFLVIASGGVACVLGGLLSQSFGAGKIARFSLSLSCLCCLLSPLFLFSRHPAVMIVFLFFWGMVVVADSPLFSTLVAQNAREESRGTSLTFVNCIGFSITIISIQTIKFLSGYTGPYYIYMLLAIGPALGITAMYRNKKNFA